MRRPILLLSPDPDAEERFRQELSASDIVQAFTPEQGQQLNSQLSPRWLVSTTESCGWALDCIDRTLLDYDRLTGLLNREGFIERLKAHSLLTSMTALLMFSIDRFSNINDTFGLEFGDELLKALAHRLMDITREQDLIGRLGSDLFAVHIHGLQDEQNVHDLAHRFLNALQEPYEVNGRMVHLSFSIGVATRPPLATPMQQLNAANRARVEAKSRQGRQLVFYKLEMNMETGRQVRLENHLRFALEKGEIEVFYQPQVRADDGSLYGAEALIRWNHPRMGLISPQEFVPIAERIGLIQPISLFALDRVLEDAQTLCDRGHRLHFSVNLSPVQFHYPELVDEITRRVSAQQRPAEMLEIEITESQAIARVDEALDIMNRLRALGVRLALDDFGTGQSSLAWLSRFPINTLKIDRGFVIQLPDEAAAKVIRAICALAKTLNLQLVAEGVETEDQARFLKDAGVDLLQGYLFGKPMTFQDFLNTCEPAGD